MTIKEIIRSKISSAIESAIENVDFAIRLAGEFGTEIEVIGAEL